MKKLLLTIFAIFLFMIFHSTASAYTVSALQGLTVSTSSPMILNYSGLSSTLLNTNMGCGSETIGGLYNGGLYHFTNMAGAGSPSWFASDGANGQNSCNTTFRNYLENTLSMGPSLQIDMTGFFNYVYGSSAADAYMGWFVNDNLYMYHIHRDTSGVVSLPDNSTPPSCTDGIKNQGETGIDVGGPCFYVSLNWPADVSQVPDFAQWTVAYYGNDTAINTATMQKGVMWSDNKTLLDSCLNYPSSTATYASCFALADPVHIDFGADLYISSPTHSEFIDKIGTMNPAQTYYAKAVLYSVNDTSLNRETLLSYGSDISFTIDNTVGTAGASNLCSGIDIGCILKAVFNWAFVPTQASLTQFSNLGTFLSSKAPFGYANEIYTEMTTITYNADQTPTVIIPQVQFIDDDIFTPMRNGLEWILWFSFGFYLFKRFKDIDI